MGSKQTLHTDKTGSSTEQKTWPVYIQTWRVDFADARSVFAVQTASPALDFRGEGGGGGEG